MTIRTRKSSTSTRVTPEAETENPARKVLSRARKPSADKVAEAKQGDVLDVAVPEVVAPAQGVALEGLDRPVTGRGVFAVRTLGNAVSVESAFLEESGNVLRLPAVFPNREYAMQQIDELRQIVNAHFDDVDKAAN